MPTSWEWETEHDMQMLLAGRLPRDEYLSSRAFDAEVFAELFELDGTQRGFEIGSGEGVVARALAPRCLALDCADISGSFLRKAAETCRGLENVRFHLIEDRYLEFLPPDHYDFGFALGLFIHFNTYDIYHYLASVKSILKPGGLFYFDIATLTPDNHAVFREHARYYRELRDPRLTRTLLSWTDRAVLDAVIEEAGLTVRSEGVLKTRQSHFVLVAKEDRASPRAGRD